jgi:hypothetical protein
VVESNRTLCQYGEGIVSVSMHRNSDRVNGIYLFSVPLHNHNTSNTHCIVLILRVSRKLEVGYESGLITKIIVFQLCNYVIGHVCSIVVSKCVSSATVLLRVLKLGVFIEGKIDRENIC